jgi:hypothetical protein
LKRAKKTLEHALAIDGIEAETRIEGRVALEQAIFLLGEQKQAYQQVICAQDEAHQIGLAWLTPRIQRLLGSILAAQGCNEKASEHFEQALQTAQKYNMHLESARAMLDYGRALLMEETRQGKGDQRGLQYLHEACQLFTKCNATLELQGVEQFLASYEEQCTQEIVA